ncbi:glycine-rich protein-like [Syzygium oleosum]|uniref:glycine-rich protein-like n=1 Tax=Syzygium oleosum TaxID=219896 RepID=UPI0024BB15E4|nr:glycine-rich protein-like [Syzygium oleosum]
MSSRVLILLSVLVSCVLVISSEVSFRELAETTSKVEDATSTATTETNDVNDAKYGGYGGYQGGREYPGSGSRGYPGQGGHGSGRGGYGQCCPYGCCGSRRRHYGGGSCRCCAYAGEAAETEPEEKPQN